MKMVSPSGKVTIGVHPSYVQSYLNSGYKPADEVVVKKDKPLKKVKKLEENTDGIS
jgi:hypothetical protein